MIMTQNNQKTGKTLKDARKRNSMFAKHSLFFYSFIIFSITFNERG